MWSHQIFESGVEKNTFITNSDQSCFASRSRWKKGPTALWNTVNKYRLDAQVLTGETVVAVACGTASTNSVSDMYRYIEYHVIHIPLASPNSGHHAGRFEPQNSHSHATNTWFHWYTYHQSYIRERVHGQCPWWDEGRAPGQYKDEWCQKDEGYVSLEVDAKANTSQLRVVGPDLPKPSWDVHIQSCQNSMSGQLSKRYDLELAGNGTGLDITDGTL